MAKDERGTKRQCEHCATKYYDLNRDPILCPGCGEPYVEPAEPTPRKSKEKPEEAKEETGATTEVELDPAVAEADAEVVSFEDVEVEDADDDVADDSTKDIPDVEGIEDIGGEVDNSFVDDADEDEANIDFGIKAAKDDE